jgi:uncharacterized RDD family membrane protein YckC
MANTAEQSYGGFWVRVLAYLVDSVVFFTILIGVIAGAAFLGDLAFMVVSAVAVLGPILYWGLMQASARQATFGKSLLGLKVTDSDGERLSLLRSLAREVAKYVSAIPMGLGFLLAAFTGRKQALHDMLVSTTVVRDSSGHVLVALLVGLFGWIAPAALVMVLGVGMVAGMMGGMGAGMMEQALTDAPKQAMQSPPPSRPAAPQPAVAARPVEAVAPAQPQAVAPPIAVEAPAPAPKVAAVEPKRAAVVPKPVAAARALDLPGQLQERTVALPGTLESLPARSGPKYNDLMSAVMSSDVAALNELLAMGKWPDKPDSHGMTPLTAAAMRGDAASVEVLVKAGADSDRALAVARMRRDAAMTSLLERYATSKRP